MQEDDDRFYLIAYCTCPPDDAPEIARELVRRKVCACANIVPGLQSVYLWKGSIETDAESLLVIKTRSDRFEDLHEVIAERHPHEVFELIASRVEAASGDYIAWIDECVGRDA